MEGQMDAPIQKNIPNFYLRNCKIGTELKI